MSLQNIKNAIYQGLDELFTTAAVDELAGDSEAYRKKLETVALVADALGISTEITEIKIILSEEKTNEEHNS